MSEGIKRFHFNLLGGKGLEIALERDSMVLEQGGRKLSIQYDEITEEVGYGFGALCGVAVVVNPKKKARCLHMYEAGGHSQLQEFHEALSSRLDSYRARTDLAVSGIPLRFTCLALFSSWRKDAARASP